MCCPPLRGFEQIPTQKKEHPWKRYSHEMRLREQEIKQYSRI
jgi:hypothetical protein